MRTRAIERVQCGDHRLRRRGMWICHTIGPVATHRGAARLPPPARERAARAVRDGARSHRAARHRPRAARDRPPRPAAARQRRRLPVAVRRGAPGLLRALGRGLGVGRVRPHARPARGRHLRRGRGGEEAALLQRLRQRPRVHARRHARPQHHRRAGHVDPRRAAARGGQGDRRAVRRRSREPHLHAAADRAAGLARRPRRGRDRERAALPGEPGGARARAGPQRRGAVGGGRARAAHVAAGRAAGHPRARRGPRAGAARPRDDRRRHAARAVRRLECPRRTCARRCGAAARTAARSGVARRDGRGGLPAGRRACCSATRSSRRPRCARSSAGR